MTKITLRTSTALLLAALALPAAALAQDIAPLPTPVPAPAPTPAPAPVPAPAPSATTVTPPAVTRTTPDTPPEAEAEAEAPPPRAARTPRATPERRAAPAAAESAPEPAATPEPAAAAPEPAVTEPLPPPVAAETEPLANEAVAEPAAETTLDIATLWPWLAAGGVVLLALIAFLAMRRRRAEEDYDETYAPAYEAPAAAPPVHDPAPAVAAAAVPPEPAPVETAYAPPEDDIVEPASLNGSEPEPRVATGGTSEQRIISNPAAYAAGIPVLGAKAREPAPDAWREPAAETPAVEAELTDAASADVAALAADSDAPEGRPWLELLMRPIRAGANETDAVVEFELTIGNTGSVAAEDVRISTWMFAAGSPQEADVERLLIDPPAESRLSEVTIQPGDGAKVEATVALPRAGLNGPVLPVVVADARYALPGGGEGRVSASFAVGQGEGVEPFPLDRPGGALSEDIGARLHGELTRA